MLKYTGHPLVDVGAATIAAYVGKRDPTRLTSHDLDRVADYITRTYAEPPLRGFLHGAVFPNSGYTNPGIKGDRRGYFGPILYAYREGAADGGEPCALCGAPAVQRVARDYFPLLTGRGVINFYPEGDSGLPVCGSCLLCVQAYPLGAGDLMLVVHSDNERITYHFAREFLGHNRRNIDLTRQAGEKKLRKMHFDHRTLLIDTLLRAEDWHKDERLNAAPFSVTAYLLSNNGQNPTLEIFHLPLQVIAFLGEMNTGDYVHLWRPLVQRAWEIPPRGKKPDPNFQPRRNWLYEDLFDLPQNSAQFLRTYMLRLALRYARGKSDPRTDYSLQSETALVSWSVTASFLRRIMNMDQEHVEQIRKLGDDLADYVRSQNDRRFFRQFFIEQRYGFFRTNLVKANLAHVRAGHPPIITLKPYIEVFEEGDEVPFWDWRLARDLVLIRMVERLHEAGWFAANADAVPEEALSIEESAPAE